MENGPQLTALVDRLCERHPSFPRRTVERLVLRTAAQMQEAGQDVHPDEILQVAGEQLTYVEQSDADRPLRPST